MLYTSLENGIEVVMTGRGGYPVGRLWSQRFGSITTIRRNQLEWSVHRDASPYITEILERKTANQRSLLYSLYGRGHAADSVLEKADVQMAAAQARLRPGKFGKPESHFDKWRSAEGTISRMYFQTLSAAIPREWAFPERSQHPAKDAFNALLNYGYGIMYHRIEGALLTAGLDPSIGVFHADGYRRPSLVYDFIEPYRCWVDFVATELVLAKALGVDDFGTIDEEGEGIFLSEGARRIIVQAVVDHYSEIIEFDGLSRSRLNHMQSAAHSLAQYLLKWKN